MPQFSKIDIENFKHAFELFDKDGSGSISREVLLTLNCIIVNLNSVQINEDKFVRQLTRNHNVEFRYQS